MYYTRFISKFYFGARAAAFLVAPKNCYFRRVCTSSLYSACTVSETLQNAPLDAFVAVDSAEIQPFNVEVKVQVRA